MCSLIEDILPANFYSHSLLGLRADELVVKHLMQAIYLHKFKFKHPFYSIQFIQTPFLFCIIQVHLPDLTELVKELQMEMTTITANWLLTLFSSVFPPRTLFCLWDLIFSIGSTVIFRV